MEINKEILKGHIDTLILSLLHRRDMYGYELAKIVREKSDDQFELKEGTLYLSLKRLEKNEWVSSYWGMNKDQEEEENITSLHPWVKKNLKKAFGMEICKKINRYVFGRGEKIEAN